MGVPTTYLESTRWLDFYNRSGKEIPPHGVFYAQGKRFTNYKSLKGGSPVQFSERVLPKDKGSDGESLDSLQLSVGYGNLLLIAEAPTGSTSRPTAYYMDGHYFVNGPTPVPNNSWGRCTNQWPAIARCRGFSSGGKVRIPFTLRSVKLAPDAKSFDLVVNYAGFASGRISDRMVSGSINFVQESSGWYGAPETFAILDVIDGFDGDEGLAWVKPVRQRELPKGYSLSVSSPNESGNFVRDGGQNGILEVRSYDLFSTEAPWAVFSDGGKVCFNLPGFYDIDLRVDFVGSVGSAYDALDNPYSQMSLRLLCENASQENIEFQSTPTQHTIALPVIRQGNYGEPSTYLSVYSHSHVRARLAVSEPKGFNPYEPSDTILAKCSLFVGRHTNAPDDMAVYVLGEGTIRSYGATAADLAKVANA